MKPETLHFILASQSPRRKELLQGLDIPFTVAAPYDVDESYPAHLQKDEVPLYLSQLKAEKYPYPIENRDIIITADTLVWCKNQFLGKPKDEQEARRFLQMLSGNAHEVLTGVCLRSRQKTHSFLTSTQVFFGSLSDAEIDYYVQHYCPLDKAGAYGIQDWIGYVGIERIEGSYYNVMGLPVQRLYKELERFND
ncbi:Maf-like protein [Bacteroidia bacterium]|nr:Maf-like protein [Bacteroidia bacterium]